MHCCKIDKGIPLSPTRLIELYRKEVFPEPATILAPTSRILGLDRRKMSKSYNNSIYLTDNDKEIRTKVSQMVTDPQRVRKSDPGDPDVCNVFTFHQIYSSEDMVSQINEECRKAEIGCVECKKMMAENLIKALLPIREKRNELDSNPGMVKEIIDKGNKRAKSIAEETMAEVKNVIGI